MRLNDVIPPTALPVPSSTTTVKKDSSVAGLFGRSRSYKFWALAAVTLLAVWSMFTGSLTLKWSAGNLTHFSDGADPLVLDDLDILVPNTASLSLYFIIFRYWILFCWFTVLDRKWRRERRWWCTCGACTRRARVRDCPGFGRRPLKLLTSIWLVIFSASETPPFRKSQRCPCAPSVSTRFLLPQRLPPPLLLLLLLLLLHSPLIYMCVCARARARAN